MADVWQQYKDLTGRDATAEERAWITNVADQGYFGGPEGTVLARARAMQQQANSIKAEAASFGLTLSDQEAAKIRDQVNPSGMTDASRTQELARNVISTRMQADTQTKQQNEIDKALHPEKYLGTDKLTEYQNTAAQQIKSILGRDATPEEAQYFANELAKGTSAYELQSMLKMTPEYQNTQAELERQAMAEESAAAQAELGNKMQGFSDEAFKRALPEIMGQYMRSGRINSSGVDAAIAKAKADLTAKQQEFLANTAYQTAQQQAGYRRQDFTTNAANAFNQYLRQSEPSYQQQFNLQNAGNYATYQSPWDTIKYNQSAMQGLTQRDREIYDYNRQQSDYANYLNQQNKSNRETALYNLLGNVGGMAAQVGLMKYAGAFNKGG